VDEGLQETLRGLRERTVQWEGESISLAEHLERLVAHETLHHGQWIVYVRLMGRSFPLSWAAWGL
jgi:uncharacterized damage-inducible protein DinB